jgi:hypothetical protein
MRGKCMLIKKVISGGQTGVDRAGLDAAIELGIEHGGYAPKGRIAEDGLIPEKYNMEVLTQGSYSARTKKNIEGSDGTVIFCKGRPKTGTKLTVDHAVKIEKPHLVVDLDTVTHSIAVKIVRDWIMKNNVQVLNVAGPRLSGAPTVAVMAKNILLDVLNG